MATGAACVAVLLIGSFVWVMMGPRPHRPSGDGSWAGSPAFLNLSIPATVLRLMDRPDDWRVLPSSWSGGNSLEDVELSPAARLASLATAVALLGAGLFSVFRHGRYASVLPIVAALIALALAAAPVSWYHYRLLHLPGFAWLAWELCTRGRHRKLFLLGILALVVTWSHLAWLEPVGWVVEPWLVLTRGVVVPVLELILAWWYLQVAGAIGSRRDEAGA